MTNSPTAALSEAGVSIWLDDLSRERLVTGDLAAAHRREERRRRHHNPTIFAGALQERRVRTSTSRARRSGHHVDTAIFDITTDDVRPRPTSSARLRPHRRRRRPRVDRGRARPRSRRRRHHRPGEGRSGPRSTARTRMIKIPATVEGLEAITATTAARHQRERHPDLQPRPSPRRSSTRTSPDSRRPGPPASTSRRSTPSHRSSCRVSTPRSTTASTAIGTDEAIALKSKAGVANAQLAYERLRAGVRHRARHRTARRRRQRAAAAVGVDRCQGPDAARHPLRDRARRCRRRQHDAREDDARPRSTTASSPATPSPAHTPMPSAVLDALAAARRLVRRRDPARSRTRASRSSSSRGANCSRRVTRRTGGGAMSFRIAVSGAAADAVRRHRSGALVDDLVAMPASPLRTRRCGARRPKPSRRSVSAGPSPSPSHGRSSPRSTRCVTQLDADGVSHIVLARHGRVVTGSQRSSRAPRASTSPCWTPPSPARCSPRSATGSRRRLSSSRRSRARPSRPTASAVSTSRRSATPASTRRSASSSSPTPVRRSTTSARAAGYRVFNADPTVGGRYSALTAFGLVPSGLAGVDIAETPRRGRDDLRSRSRSTPPRTPASCSVRRSPRRRRCATSSPWWRTVRTSSASPTGQSSSIAGVHGQGRHRHPARRARQGRTRADGRPLRRAGRSTRRRRGRPRSSPHHDTGEIRVSGTLGAQLLVWEYATAVAGRLLGINPFDQPDVESAKIAARGLLDARPAPEPAAFVETASRFAERPRSSARRATSSRRSTCCSRSCQRTATSRCRHMSTGWRTPRSPRIRDRLAARSRSSGHVRLGSALPALDRSVPQGRSGRRRLPADHPVAGRRPRDPRSSLHLRPAHRGPGIG